MGLMYIVVPNKRAGGTGADLRHFLEVLEGMAGCSVKKLIGKETEPERLLIEATPDAIEQLRHAYGSRLIIEPDSPLTLL